MSPLSPWWKLPLWLLVSCRSGLWTIVVGSSSSEQGLAWQPPPSTEAPPTAADILRGEYGRYRANNDLLFYRLDVRVNPATKSIAGTNTIRFRMLADDTRIQLERIAPERHRRELWLARATIH